MAKQDILIIGDSHVRPDISTERFDWLGKYCADVKPDIIVDMGDWADMPSLSSYDIGKRSYEGRRYVRDVAAAIEARERFNQGIARANRSLATRHLAQYRPKKIALGGNHDEGRILKACQDDPKLEGLIGVKDFQHAEYGWEYVPFRTPIELCGFTFCHYFTSGIMLRPIGGEMPALSLVRKQLASCVAGHSHLFDIAHRSKPNGERVWGIIAGCYLAEDQWEDYAHEANQLWWKGVVRLRGCENGDFESLETVTIKQLRKEYAS